MSEGSNLDGECHACPGALSVTYLHRSPELITEAPPEVFYGGGWGGAPSYSLGPKLNSYPLLVIEHGFTGQGVTESSVELIMLGPAASQISSVGTLPTGFSDSGVSDDENVCEIEAHIVPGVVDQSFRLQYSGSFSKVVDYRWTGGEWRPSEDVGNLYSRCPATMDAGGVPPEAPLRSPP